MSNELPSRLIQTHAQDARITLVASTYNERFTDALVDNCLAEIEETAPYHNVEVLRVPGAFEIPVMIKRAISLPEEGKPDIVIALGVILRGSTAHANLIGKAVTGKLLDIACETNVPVIHEVLLLDSEEQAFARCIAATLNRGREAARAALRMLDVMEEQNVAIRNAKRSAQINPNASLIA